MGWDEDEGKRSVVCAKDQTWHCSKPVNDNSTAQQARQHCSTYSTYTTSVGNSGQG